MSKNDFQKRSDMWLEPDRLKRMRYLIDNLVRNDEVYLSLYKGEIFVAKSKDGNFVLPIWPSESDFQKTFGNKNMEFVAIKYRSEDFLEQIVSELRQDELFAVFPDTKNSYEQLTSDEMKDAINFVKLMFNGESGSLSKLDKEKILKYYPFLKDN